jgi:CubicO group peptidase (beta-lactamase class C family)
LANGGQTGGDGVRLLLIFKALFCCSLVLAATRPAPVPSSATPRAQAPVGQALSQAVEKQRRAIEDLQRFTFANHTGGPQTDALLVLQNDQILAENYARGFTPLSRHFLWSISKSITATIVAAGMQRGLLRRSDSVCRVGRASPRPPAP